LREVPAGVPERNGFRAIIHEMTTRVLPLLLLLVLAACASARAETGEDAWLRYEPLDAASRARYDDLPACIVALGDSPVVASARDELVRGARGMLGRTERVESRPPAEPAIVLGTFAEGERALPCASVAADLPPDGYRIVALETGGRRLLVVAAPNDRGVLYGTFALLRGIALHRPLASLDERAAPAEPIRWVNEWDNLDGTIERGYGGASIFFENGAVASDLSRVREYARLLASIGVFGCTINNVNADARLLTDAYVPQLARVADAMRPWGVRIAISVDFSSPKSLGGRATFDPLDPAVARFWKDRVDALYARIPDFGGFTLKADSEGRLGPSAYGRTHADAANVIARALAPHGGLIFYRGFVYDHHMDWRNLKNDRARAAYDNFKPLDGAFDANVVLQIKHGPIDFQVREPASPLFGALERTNQSVELQITQEYTGQQRHVCYLVPMWKTALDFDMQAKGPGTPVKALVSGSVFGRPTGGFVGVSNVGRDATWLGHHLAMANLYGFGRLAWDPDLSSEAIADEWTRQTFGHDAAVVETVTGILRDSWPAFESYSGPLGMQSLTEITGNHYGPGPESSERNGWGQWHRAGPDGVGMDRTVASGTGFVGQYRPGAAKRFETLEACPDELLLFMHHVPWTYRLKSGETVIQHQYDAHYDGAATAESFVRRWAALRGRVDERRFAEVLGKLEYQSGHAVVWRDALCDWFLETSGVPDVRGRVGNHPERTEAEAMTLDGYRVEEMTPFEAASRSRYVRCADPSRRCAARFLFDGPAGWYDLLIQYFDQNDGVSRYRALVAGQPVDAWAADDTLPTKKSDAHSSSRRRVRGIALRPGDEIRVEGVGDGNEDAPLDYVEVRAAERR
jgi:alpha-glucuronidase